MPGKEGGGGSGPLCRHILQLPKPRSFTFPWCNSEQPKDRRQPSSSFPRQGAEPGMTFSPTVQAVSRQKHSLEVPSAKTPRRRARCKRKGKDRLLGHPHPSAAIWGSASVAYQEPPPSSLTTTGHHTHKTNSQALTRLTGLHLTLVKGLRAPKGRR